MSEFYFYCGLFGVSFGYIFFVATKNVPRGQGQRQEHDNAILIIEQLTAHSSKPKNYRRAPNEYAFFGYQVFGTVEGDSATFQYIFPFIDNRNVCFATNISTSEMSSAVSAFGVHNTCFAPLDHKRFALQTNDEAFLRENMNRDGFFYRSHNTYDFGINFAEVIKLSEPLLRRVANFLVNELGAKDSYTNRILAALNFVQFLPYGQPNFDAGEYTYFGLSLPHESLVISYADCDSKSVLLCGILKEMLDDWEKYVILVYCYARGVHHMIVGVHGVSFEGQKYYFQGRDYVLLETTTPISLSQQRNLTYENIVVYNFT